MITEVKTSLLLLALTPIPILGVMSDEVKLAIVAAVVPSIVAIGAIIVALKKTNKKIDDLSVAVDGRLTKLLEETSKARLAEGKLAGKAEEKFEAALIAGAKVEPATDGTEKGPTP